MPKPLPDPAPDAMAREVDRLLARLEREGPRAERPPDPPPLAARTSSPAPTLSRPRPATTDWPPLLHPVDRGKSAPAAPAPSRRRFDREALGLWTRVLLGATLGILMLQWPYAHGCGWGLAGYAGAVFTVMLAGAWVAVASWKQRSAAAHVLALVLVFWGIVLAAEQILPRIGYAATDASWQCGRGD